jgi:hypothetical protein
LQTKVNAQSLALLEENSMKLDIKPSTALAIGGIVLAAAFLVTAIVSPASLDRILHPATS